MLFSGPALHWGYRWPSVGASQQQPEPKGIQVIAEDLGFCFANRKCNWKQPGRIQLQRELAGVK